MSLKIQTHEPFDEGYETSIKKLAEDNGLDYLEAQGFVKTLVKLGNAKQTRTHKVEGQKGKPTNIYLLPHCLQITIYEEVSVLEVASRPDAA